MLVIPSRRSGKRRRVVHHGVKLDAQPGAQRFYALGRRHETAAHFGRPNNEGQRFGMVTHALQIRMR